MKRNIPLLIVLIAGLVVIASEFIPHRPFSKINETLEVWFMLIAGFAMILGQVSLVQVNSSKIKNKVKDWPYYLVGLISFATMLIVGLLWGMDQTKGLLGQGESIQAWLGMKPFDYFFEYIYQHLSATMFSLLAFYIASAAYRAFIIRSFESNLLMITAVIVILGRSSFGAMLTSGLSDSWRFLHLPILTDFIMEFPNSAAQRAIMISAALGIIGSSLRIILGIERSYLGGDK